MKPTWKSGKVLQTQSNKKKRRRKQIRKQNKKKLKIKRRKVKIAKNHPLFDDWMNFAKLFNRPRLLTFFFFSLMILLYFNSCVVKRYFSPLQWVEKIQFIFEMLNSRLTTTYVHKIIEKRNKNHIKGGFEPLFFKFIYSISFETFYIHI